METITTKFFSDKILTVRIHNCTPSVGYDEKENNFFLDINLQDFLENDDLEMTKYISFLGAMLAEAYVIVLKLEMTTVNDKANLVADCVGIVLSLIDTGYGYYE